jgi:uncharacterized membrane protein YphA (DoxX/SURF4 family)
MELWSTRERRMGLALAGLRVMMGGIFLAVWTDNLAKGLYSPDGWADFVQTYADTTRAPLYADILNEIVIPNAALFAYGQLVTELIVMGLFLFIGFLTPIAGLIGAAFQFNLLLATSGIPTEWPGTYLTMVLVLVAVAVAQSGRTLGVDALLAARQPHPRVPLY